MTRHFVRNILLALCMLSASGAHAEAPRVLAWEELTVKLSGAENPFSTLTMEQLTAVADVAGFRLRRSHGFTLSQEEIASERAALARLRKDGIDADRLLAKREEVAEKRRVNARMVNPELNAKLVRIAGYLLPLEFSGKQVTEFLLVPWVGACIHTPPPAPNQIVHVKSDKPVEVRGIFEPVWVTGRMATTASRKTVEIVDGSSEVEVGYSLRASQVEAYKQ